MDRFTARRKLLRGSLSAPLVLTVASSPAAAAARGSWEACLLRAGENPREALPWIAGDQMDHWLRLRVPLYKGTLDKKDAASTSVEGVGQESAAAVPGQTGGEGSTTGPRRVGWTNQPSSKDAEPNSGLNSTTEKDETVEPAENGDKDYYLLDDRYYPVEPDEQGCGGYQEDDFQNIKPDKDKEIQLLVYVDDTGRVIGAGPCASAAGEGFPVSGSCWASFGGMQV